MGRHMNYFLGPQSVRGDSVEIKYFVGDSITDGG
jgi:hypothetical protein